MAIIRLDCNLNGGDSVTPNNELFYRIYGDVDNYASPIHTTGTALSDANVTVNNDNVIITGVDGTTNTIFKIAAVDGAGNEGILSDAVSGSIILFQDDFAGQVLNPNGDWTVTDPADGVTISQDDSILFNRTGDADVAWSDNQYANTSGIFGSVFCASVDISGTNVVTTQYGFKVLSVSGTSVMNLRGRDNSGRDADMWGTDSTGTGIGAPNTNYAGVDPLGKTWKIRHDGVTLFYEYWDGGSWVLVHSVATNGLIDSDLHVMLTGGDMAGDSAGDVSFNNMYVTSENYLTQYPE